MYVTGYAHGIDPPKCETWKSIERLLEDGAGTPAWHSLIASSSEHLSVGDHRLAVIDAVTAIEAIALRLFPQSLEKISGFSELGIEWISSNMTNGQLQPVAKRCLPIFVREKLIIRIVINPCAFRGSCIDRPIESPPA